MNKDKIVSVATYSLITAILFSIPMVFYVRQQTFVSSWLLFLGNMMFGIGSALFMWKHVAIRKEGASTGSTVTLGHFVTVGGVILSCLFSFLALMIFAPETVAGQGNEQFFQNAPAQLKDGESNGFVMVLYMTAIIGNISVGSLINIILAYTAKRNQTTDKEPNFLNEKRGVAK